MLIAKKGLKMKIIDDLKVFFSAFYDGEHHKIVGVKKKDNPIIWKHEMGHKKFAERCEWIGGLKVNLMLYGILLMMVLDNNILVSSIGSLLIGIIIGEEIVAWNYAFKKNKKED